MVQDQHDAGGTFAGSTSPTGSERILIAVGPVGCWRVLTCLDPHSDLKDVPGFSGPHGPLVVRKGHDGRWQGVCLMNGLALSAPAKGSFSDRVLSNGC